MGFPSQGVEGFYRNSLQDTRAFLEAKHANHYKIYNLCIEDDRRYEPALFFKGIVNNDYLFYDHNPPPFEMVIKFCKDIEAFLKESSSNIVAIHCKAGKGRTGVMICCYLVYSQYCKSAYEALVYYGKIRTKDEKGVTIPSQIRYVYYFAAFMKWRTENSIKSLNLPKVIQKIYKIRIITIPSLLKGGFFPNFTVCCKGYVFYDYNKSETERQDKFLRGISYHDFVITQSEPLVYDDVKITFYN